MRDAGANQSIGQRFEGVGFDDATERIKDDRVMRDDEIGRAVLGLFDDLRRQVECNQTPADALAGIPNLKSDIVVRLGGPPGSPGLKNVRYVSNCWHGEAKCLLNVALGRPR